MAEVNDLHRNALSPQGDCHRRDHERRLHLVGHQRFFDFREALKHARDEEMSGLRVGGDVVGDRASEMSRYGYVRDIELAIRFRQPVVHQHLPVHVERKVRGGEGKDPGGDGEG